MRIAALFAFVVFVLSYITLRTGGADYARDIAPASRKWWSAPWKNGLPQAPWLALLLWPLTVLPDRLATALTNAASVCVIGALIRRFRGPAWLIVPMIISPPFYWLCTNGQTDALILGSLLLPCGWAAVVLAIKPQIAALAVLARIRSRRILLPIAIVLAASLLIWGLWPVEIARGYGGLLTGSAWNSSLWPWSVPAGLVFSYLAFCRRDERWGIVASPLLSPYVNMPSYLGLMVVAACRFPRAFLAIWLSLVAYAIGFVLFAMR